MAEERHRTVIEVRADTRHAERAVDGLQNKLDRAGQTAGGIVGGGAAPPAPGAAPGVGARDRQRADTRRRRIGAAAGLGARAGGAAGGLIQGMGSIGGVVGGVGGIAAFGAASAANAIRQNAMANPRTGASGFLQRMGVGLSAGIPLGVGAIVGLGVQSLAIRQQTASQRASLVRQHNIAAMNAGAGRRGIQFGRRTMGMNSFLRRMASGGFAPEEAEGLLNQFMTGRGFAGPTMGIRTFRNVARSGAGMGAISSFAGLRAPGAGGVGAGPDVTSNMIAVAQRDGLRGAGIDRFLQRIAQHTGQMAEQGLDVNLGAMEKFVRSMQSTAGVGTLGGRAPAIAAKLSGQIGGARNQLLGGFSGLGQAALMVKASQSTGGFMGMVKSLEGMQGDPEQVRQAVIEMFGPEMASLFFASIGAPTGLAGQMSGQMKPPGKRPGLKFALPGGAMRVQAQGQARRVTGMTNRQAMAMISAMEGLKTAMGGLTTWLNNVFVAIQSYQQHKNTKMLILDIIKALGGNPGAMTGGLFSDREAKHVVGQLNDAEILDLLRHVPVYEWTYKGDDVRHIGPMAQDWAAAIGGETDREIDLINFLGSLLAGVRALDRRVAQLEEAAGIAS